jgi:hypothetical protein
MAFNQNSRLDGVSLASATAILRYSHNLYEVAPGGDGPDSRPVITLRNRTVTAVVKVPMALGLP